jgi:hypothetical protein
LLHWQLPLLIRNLGVGVQQVPVIIQNIPFVFAVKIPSKTAADEHKAQSHDD